MTRWCRVAYCVMGSIKQGSKLESWGFWNYFKKWRHLRFPQSPGDKRHGNKFQGEHEICRANGKARKPYTAPHILTTERQRNLMVVNKIWDFLVSLASSFIFDIGEGRLQTGLRWYKISRHHLTRVIRRPLHKSSGKWLSHPKWKWFMPLVSLKRLVDL